MCGIVGYFGPKPATEVLLEGLKRLEYRGYDSAGVSIGDGESFHTYKRKGKVRDLREIIPEEVGGLYGIGHTRWATHGGVNDQNAHPHSDDQDNLVVVHNGIIENYQALKNKLISDGHTFKSATDTEVIAQLIAVMYKGNLEQAVREALYLLKGTYGIAVVHRKEPGKVVGARNGSPLVIGIGEGEMFLASDVMAMMAYTKNAVYLEDGELVSFTADSYKMFDIHDQQIEKEVEKITWELQQLEKDGFS